MLSMSLGEAPPRNSRLPVIGLMGAPGSGKSTVALMFEEAGCHVIDADVLAALAFDDARIQQTLRQWWGDDIVSEGKVNRKRVGEIVFNDPAQRARLEGLIHPEVNRRRAEIRAELFSQDNSPTIRAIVEDCPLLLEVGLDGQCDFVVYVDTPLTIRQERVLATRGWSADELRRREDSQASLDTKRDRADYTIDNAHGLEATGQQVHEVLKKIIEQHRRGVR